MLGGVEHFSFFRLLGIVIPTDCHIFQRGRYTTNQIVNGDYNGFYKPTNITRGLVLCVYIYMITIVIVIVIIIVVVENQWFILYHYNILQLYKGTQYINIYSLHVFVTKDAQLNQAGFVKDGINRESSVIGDLAGYALDVFLPLKLAL